MKTPFAVDEILSHTKYGRVLQYQERSVALRLIQGEKCAHDCSMTCVVTHVVRCIADIVMMSIKH